MAFGFQVAWTLKDISERLASAQIGFTIAYKSDGTILASYDPATGEHVPIKADEISFVDDIVFMLLGDDNSQLLMDLSAVVAITQDSFEQAKLEVNFQPDKSEIVLDLMGKDAPRFRHQLLIQEQGHLPVVLFSGKTIGVRIVEQYQHLGMFFHRTGLMTPEMRSRSSKTLKKFFADLIHTFKSRWISDKNIYKLFNTLVTTRLVSNGHTWARIPEKQLDILRHTQARIIKYATDKTKPDAFSASSTPNEMLYIPFTRFFPVDDILRKNRLTYYGRVITWGPPLLKAALQHEAKLEGSWSKLIVDDLLWISSRDEAFARLPPRVGHENLKIWESYVGNHPKPWRAAIRRVYHGIMNDEIELYASTDPYLVKPANPIVSIVQDYGDFKRSSCMCGSRHTCKRHCSQSEKHKTLVFHPPLAVGQDGKCPFCPLVLPNTNKYIAHLVRSHGYSAPVKIFSGTDGRCPSCLMHYHSRPRLTAHLTGKTGITGCFLQCILDGVTPYTPEEVSEMNKVEAAGIKAMKRKGGGGKASDGLPAFRAQGPIRPMMHGVWPAWSIRVPLQPL